MVSLRKLDFGFSLDFIHSFFQVGFTRTLDLESLINHT